MIVIKKNELEIPKFKDLKDKVILLKITATDWDLNTKGMPYRIIAVTRTTSLYVLAKSIVFSFNFDFDHAFGFFWPLTKHYPDSTEHFEYFADVCNDYQEECRNERRPIAKSVIKTKVACVLELLNNKMLFLFDYGDEWKFIVELYGIDDKKVNIKYPVVCKKVGRSTKQYP